MVDPSLWNEAEEKPVTEWQATMWGLTTLYYLGCLSFGVIGLFVGADHLLYPTNGFSRGDAGPLLLVGLWLLCASSASVLLTAKKVNLTDDGALVFTSRYRKLVVLPGQLQSVHTLPLDWNRLLPWRVKAVFGSIWLWPRFSSMETLWLACVANSPSVDLDRLSPLDLWRSRQG